MITPELLRSALADAVRNMDPRQMVRNPVMLVVEVAAVLVTVLWVTGLDSEPGWFSATASAFSNRGPNSASASVFYRKQLAAYLALERPYAPGLTKAEVPVDAVTTSASGVDPHISKANAAVQAHRIAAVRQIPLARVNALIEANTDGRFLGVFGEPGVNVLELNTALDR